MSRVDEPGVDLSFLCCLVLSAMVSPLLCALHATASDMYNLHPLCLEALPSSRRLEYARYLLR